MSYSVNIEVIHEDSDTVLESEECSGIIKLEDAVKMYRDAVDKLVFD